MLVTAFAWFGLAMASSSAAISAFVYKPKFECGVCMDLIDLHRRNASIGCDFFGHEACAVIDVENVLSKGGCVHAGHCRVYSPNSNAVTTTTNSEPDLRVSKGFGTKDYNLLRVSVVTEESPEYAGTFDFSSQFQHRWTENFISTSLLKVGDNGSNGTSVFNFGNHSAQLRLPQQGAGVNGILLGDPCIVSQRGTPQPVGCQFGRRFQTSARTPGLINAFMKDPTMDYWAILGDNFYDRTGKVTKEFFAALDKTTKQKILISVPGNHDYAVLGTPAIGTHLDQWSNGFIQFYAQDTKASQAVDAVGAKGKSPFDLSINPDEILPNGGHYPNIENTFTYNQIGNVGFIGFSGAYSYKESLPYFTEACAWARDEPTVKVVFLVGHWDVQGLGASKDMTVPSVLDEISKIDGCDGFAKAGNLKAWMGHTHCNVPHPHKHVDKAFMVAGQGMEGCGNYGIVVASTVNERIRVVHFPVDSVSGPDTYEQVVACVESRGWEQCIEEHAQVWLDQVIKA